MKWVIVSVGLVIACSVLLSLWISHQARSYSRDIQIQRTPQSEMTAILDDLNYAMPSRVIYDLALNSFKVEQFDDAGVACEDLPHEIELVTLSGSKRVAGLILNERSVEFVETSSGPAVDLKVPASLIWNGSGWEIQFVDGRLYGQYELHDVLDVYIQRKSCGYLPVIYWCSLEGLHVDID